MITGKTEGVTLRQATVRYIPWWIYPVLYIGGILVWAALVERQRVWLPYTTAAWRWTRFTWAIWAPLHVLGGAAVLALSMALSAMMPSTARIPAFVIGLCVGVFVVARLVHTQWLQPRTVLLGSSPHPEILVLSLPSEPAAVATRAYVRQVATRWEMDLIRDVASDLEAVGEEAAF